MFHGTCPPWAHGWYPQHGQLEDIDGPVQTSITPMIAAEVHDPGDLNCGLDMTRLYKTKNLKLNRFVQKSCTSSGFPDSDSQF
jgi:hypothetical protein